LTAQPTFSSRNQMSSVRELAGGAFVLTHLKLEMSPVIG
jgi:hypothetical protein